MGWLREPAILQPSPLQWTSSHQGAMEVAKAQFYSKITALTGEYTEIYFVKQLQSILLK
jgi:hypothetical protein